MWLWYVWVLKLSGPDLIVNRGSKSIRLRVCDDIMVRKGTNDLTLISTGLIKLLR